MTPNPDWTLFCDLLDKGWPGDLSPGAADAYEALLGGVPIDHIIDGLRRLLHAGAKFRPSAAEILAEARRDPSAPTFDEALFLIFGEPRLNDTGIMVYGAESVLAARAEPGHWTADDRRVAKDAAATERAASMHPLVASFVQRMTLGRLRRLDLANEWHVKELREAWDNFIDANDGREVKALAAGTGKRGLAKMDPLAALGLHAVPELEEGAA